MDDLLSEICLFYPIAEYWKSNELLGKTCGTSEMYVSTFSLAYSMYSTFFPIYFPTTPWFSSREYGESVVQ